jgi:hypothetical protein
MQQTGWITPVAKTGLVSKGIVYCLIGSLAFMAAFEIHGQREENADKQGVARFIEQTTGGDFLLAIIALGLICYSTWRLAEAVRKKKDPGQNSIGKRIRYAFSGLVYLSFAISAIKLLAGANKSSGGNSTKHIVSTLLSKPFGQWMVGIFAVIIASVGIYQAYYAIAGKYKKHVSKLNRRSKSSQFLLRAGKIGYVSRAFVWLTIAYLVFKSALHAKSQEAGNTGDAFQFLKSSPFGSYLLGLLALGLICYGVFNFIRAAYEKFD